MTKTISVELFGRDKVLATFTFSESTLIDVKFDATGCQKFLDQLAALREMLLKLPESERNVLKPSAKVAEVYSTLKRQDHSTILIRELILRLRDQFQLPYKESELCHCRAVPTEVVDRAIVAGAHSVPAVARVTSAGTSCGTCKPDTELLIEYRLRPLA
ncbi:MAG: (2Fe-2S)-binding protein [Deltaproteobacteria bacterium]|nr:(2Fe-2S)-binding protein [Deltaproteobacteria bacterium]